MSKLTQAQINKVNELWLIGDLVPIDDVIAVIEQVLDVEDEYGRSLINFDPQDLIDTIKGLDEYHNKIISDITDEVNLAMMNMGFAHPDANIVSEIVDEVYKRAYGDSDEQDTQIDLRDTVDIVDEIMAERYLGDDKVDGDSDEQKLGKVYDKDSMYNISTLVEHYMRSIGYTNVDADTIGDYCVKIYDKYFDPSLGEYEINKIIAEVIGKPEE